MAAAPWRVKDPMADTSWRASSRGASVAGRRACRASTSTSPIIPRGSRTSYAFSLRRPFAFSPSSPRQPPPKPDSPCGPRLILPLTTFCSRKSFPDITLYSKSLPHHPLPFTHRAPVPVAACRRGYRRCVKRPRRDIEAHAPLLSVISLTFFHNFVLFCYHYCFDNLFSSLLLFTTRFGRVSVGDVGAGRGGSMFRPALPLPRHCGVVGVVLSAGLLVGWSVCK